LIEKQNEWLRKDLQTATLTENRKQRPWIIAIGHRPMYCSNLQLNDCTTPKSLVKEAFEKVFCEFGVDVILEAHEHVYERTWPVFNHITYTIKKNPYVNPQALVHLISGAPGNKEGHAHFAGPLGDWSAYRSATFGYAVFQAVNNTHFNYKQIWDRDGSILDDVWIVREIHAPYLVCEN